MKSLMKLAYRVSQGTLACSSMIRFNHHTVGCFRLDAIANGVIVYSAFSSEENKYPSGSTATYQCQVNYSPTNPVTRRLCYDSTMWSGSPTTCESKEA
ncbi:MAG: CCP domain-containing protein [Gammaproteobacteria bacterium]|nr:CCP domain-containing protein [Gammaproteobacteria bacterium]